ncbi:VanZ family protein [Paenibacillus sp. MBLB4367]|uniref:VanZ family protein n=1 Tax=Paenibacillus sp. MBLB4367 TaxID=3384767 RepID=UPI0039081F65
MLNFSVIGVVLTPLYFLFLFINIKKKKTIFEHLIFTTFYIYISLVIKVTLFQIPIDNNLINNLLSMNSGYSLNLIPFNSMFNFYSEGGKQFWIQVGGNILMFFPLGSYIPLITKKISSFGKMLTVIICASLMIEITQRIISLLIKYNYRAVDIDDIILNTIGGLIGFVFYKLVISPLLINSSLLMNKKKLPTTNSI